MYAVVAPGYTGIHADIKDVKNLLAIHPYLKFSKVRTEEGGWEYINTHKVSRRVAGVWNYGSTFPQCHVKMEYIIGRDSTIYLNYDTSRFGTVKIANVDVPLDQRSGRISARLDSYVIDRNRISGHMVAIKAGLELIGELIDVEVIIPDYSIYYALRSYTGTKNREVLRVQEYIKQRIGEVSITLKV